MPATHVVPVLADPAIYIVNNNGVEKRAHVIQRKEGEYYVHYLDTDKRMDEWVSEDRCSLVNEPPQKARNTNRKRKRGTLSESPSPFPESPSSQNVSTRPSSAIPPDRNPSELVEEIIMTEEEYDIEQHKRLTAKRNFDDVFFGNWRIKTWYFSPYPLTEMELEDLPASSALVRSFKIPGVARTTARSHGRTLDLLVGGLSRNHGTEMSNLWVCERCFKYMSDGMTWEIHKKSCTLTCPPGRKVYQRGADIIWEVDGAKQKLYCQNLSLFGKLFIDVKTLYFDCDNFLFYILTDGASKINNMVGFFSKEKHSFDGYNLACIVVLPQYQKMRYGSLLIEFSYELSRMAGQVGTPERPLSDLGLRSYLSYWVATLIRFFRRVLSTMPQAEGLTLTSKGNPLDLNKQDHAEIAALAARKKYNDIDLYMTPLGLLHDPIFTTEKIFETTFTADGSAVSHVTVKCTLADIANATNLRIDDAGFALHECGFLMKQLSGADGDKDRVIITRALVEKVAKERDVKQMCMELKYVLL